MSIYDTVTNLNDLREDIRRIAKLLEDNINILVNYGNGGWCPCPLEKYIDVCLFNRWDYCRTCNKTADLKEDMGLPSVVQSSKDLSEDQCWLYLEYVLNMCELFDQYWNKDRPKKRDYQFDMDEVNHANYMALQRKVDEIIGSFNMKKIDRGKPNKQRLLCLIPNDPAVTEAAEIVGSSDVKDSILCYNRPSIKENPTKKRNILFSLARDFEAKRPELENMGGCGKTIADDLGNLFNNADIRHNNTSGKNANPEIREMSEKDLLEGYDIIYRLYLAAVLFHDYKKKVDAFKEKIRPPKKSPKTSGGSSSKTDSSNEDNSSAGTT